MTALEMSALHAAVELPRDSTPADAGLGGLAADCAARQSCSGVRPFPASAPNGMFDCFPGKYGLRLKVTSWGWGHTWAIHMTGRIHSSARAA